ncbi:hypothetical protein WEN_00885 [Mycoplasma wenyonii str. Massachusetts]|uniref:Uncharacterized protein n=1 Tax=Mycoplasma wenyonii (strain Massachusetts) TaxID=1197325 RepID=I6ZIH5_MYCWM|nr:hypothetical protein [Mycoplasma wenyonii]AFN64980.1 hypothetical protein WEN_00885 [Mycoplasma wenyonii str. Massachusetts]
MSEDILFVKGWDHAGKHRTIESKKHSQAERELWGGKKVTYSNSWFGPRKTSLELDNLEKVKEATKTSQKNYWTEIQRSGEFITQQDLIELQKFWEKRDKGLEEDIFGLYHGWDWWAERFGQKNGKVDLEFDLSKLKEMLGKSENELRDNPWNYGKLFKNPKLALARLAGDVEVIAFNYLKKYVWPNADSVKNLKEKNILPAIFALLTGGEETGFTCGSQTSHQSKYFGECQSDKRSQEGWRVKKVLKSTYQNSGGFWVPKHGGGPGWNTQENLKTRDKSQILNMENVSSTGLLDEKCEDAVAWYMSWSDTTNPVRREVCDRIIRPWFGDRVNDKRLCLIEVDNFSYHLRFQTYLQVIQIPTWMNKNTFWTKCSNYRI